ncbi:hypothetical protein PR048_012767 [Dryococelus australis]|uniref:Uncharacterized protein n=1 Tax=Dryococelus australis TaxID=614101 RepID=A0ABQ9HQF0_9NEOP|nr:hypothetical protein PR048_012767 [Dryococelus australis]
MLNELRKYMKTITSPELTDLQENNFEEWFTDNFDVLVVQHYTDEAILGMVTKKNNKDENSSEALDENEPAEKITQDKCVFHIRYLKARLKQCRYVSEQQLISMYLLKKQLEIEKAKKTKQTQITDVFKSLPVLATLNKQAA